MPSPDTWSISLRNEAGEWYTAHAWPTWADTWRVYERLTEPARIYRNGVRIHPTVEPEQLDLLREGRYADPAEAD